MVARGGLREKTVCLGWTLQAKDRHRDLVHPRTQLPGQEQTLQMGHLAALRSRQPGLLRAMCKMQR